MMMRNACGSKSECGEDVDGGGWKYSEGNLVIKRNQLFINKQTTIYITACLDELTNILTKNSQNRVCERERFEVRKKC